MKQYIIMRHCAENLSGMVTVDVIEDDSTRNLTPEASQKVNNHSPDGFEFGYGGSGPAQLALAILMDFAGEQIASLKYQDFKRDFIAGIPHPGGVINGDEIEAWLAKVEEEQS